MRVVVGALTCLGGERGASIKPGSKNPPSPSITFALLSFSTIIPLRTNTILGSLNCWPSNTRILVVANLTSGESISQYADILIYLRLKQLTTTDTPRDFFTNCETSLYIVVEGFLDTIDGRFVKSGPSFSGPTAISGLSNLRTVIFQKKRSRHASYPKQ
jgi:hypothetical protein